MIQAYAFCDGRCNEQQYVALLLQRISGELERTSR
jgi:hypothetical protein